MKAFTEQLENLYENMRKVIIDKVREKGEPIELSINLAQSIGNTRFHKLKEDVILDDQGYEFNYSILSYEELAELTDWVKDLKQEKPTERTLENIIDEIEKHHSIDEYKEDGELCGYEINTYTNGGVNMIIFLDFRDSEYDPKNPTHFLKVFEDRIESIDIDEEIVLHREMKNYTDNFTLSESLEDFNDWRDSLNKLIEKL